MTVKIVVLYPHPTDPEAFERGYHGEHMPLMRRLAPPAERTPTFKVRGESAPFYRMAEVHFTDMDALRAYVRSEGARAGRRSSEKVSSGGPPIFLVCEADTVGYC